MTLFGWDHKKTSWGWAKPAQYKLELAKFCFGSVAGLKFECMVQIGVVGIVNNQICHWKNVVWTKVARIDVTWANVTGMAKSMSKEIFEEKENFLSNTIWVKKIWFQNEIGKNNMGERKGGPQNF